MNTTSLFYDSYLAHYGIKGQKWGVRRFQNKDMSLTPAGRKRYADDNSGKRAVRGHAGPGMYTTKKRQLEGDKRDLEGLKKGQHLSVGLTKKRQAALDARDKAALEKRIAKNEAKLSKKELTPEQKKERMVKAAKVGAAVVGTAVAAYGAYKVGRFIKDKNISIAREKGKSLAEEYLSNNKIVYATSGFERGTDRAAIWAKTKSGNEFTFAKEGDNYHDVWNSLNKYISDHNDRTDKMASQMRTSYVNRAAKDSLGTATKNVANYYKEEVSKKASVTKDMGKEIYDKVTKEYKERLKRKR